ncbi:MAG TPA: hypothetical protein VFK13_08930 [Gemmatimonadaceae bacterium]|nr:hypothetical protein [Gemmatimonadaceae bacterium]
MSRSVHVLSMLSAALVVASAAAAQSTSYHVAKRVTIGGEGGWDYVVIDAPRHRLFVSRGTHVMVVDTDRDSVIADIANTPGVHGVALAPELGRGFTSNGRDSSVTIFDYATLATIGVVHGTGANPDAILYDPTTRRVFTFNGRSGDATAIDAASGAIVGTVPLGGKPEAASHDGHGRIFVNIEDTGEVVAFDARTLAVQARWPVHGCEEPTGQGIDRAHALLFLGCGGSRTMAVVNYRTGAVVATLPIGAGVDGAAFDPGTGLAFTSNGAGTLTVVHEDSPTRFTVLGNVPTQRGARTMSLDEGSHRVYTVTAEFGPPPAASAGAPSRRPPMVPGSFTVLELDP